MNENLRIKLYSKLISGNEILSQLKNRKKDYITESISFESREIYIENGWKIDTEFKNSLRVTKEKQIDVAFEDKVWSLFAQLGYDFLNKDRGLHLPYDKSNPDLTQQIDVFVKDKETVLLIECKASEKFKRGDFKKELEAMTSKIGGLKSTVNSLFPENKLKIKYILVTKNQSISEEDAARLKNIGGIYFNEDNIDYFYALFSQIGHASKYQLLGTIFDGQEISEMENRVPAVRGSMGGFTYYSFCIEPEKILKIGYVLHRNKAHVNMMPTYQRVIKKARLKSVEEFIENGGYFPNSIVISLDQGDLKFERANTQGDDTISRAGILHLPKRYRSAYIIDGQHRLYGYSNSKYKGKHAIPVVAFLKLSREEQVKLFMQINENQKPVSKDLRITLNSDLLWTSESYIEQMRALCSRIAIFLGEDKDSALYDKVSIGEDKKIITSSAIENALRKSSFLGKVTKTKIEELGTIYNGNLEETFQTLKEYLNLGFKYISENSSDEWNNSNGMLLINKGIFAIILTMGDILLHLKEKSIIDPRKDSIKNIFNETKTYLDPVICYINTLDQETKNSLKSSYGANGDTKYWRNFQKAIQDTHKEFIPTGLAEYLLKEEKRYNDEAISLVRDLEMYLKKDFRQRLEEHFGKKWFEKGVPPSIANEASVQALGKNREKEDNDESTVEAWDCINIIAYREIASKNWQTIFEKEYTRPGEEKGNISKEEKTKWMQKLERIRNQNFHSYSVSEEELDFLHETHDWLVKKETRNKYQLA